MPSLGSPKLQIFKPSTFLGISQLAEGVLYRFLDFQEAGSFLYLEIIIIPELKDISN